MLAVFIGYLALVYAELPLTLHSFLRVVPMAGSPSESVAGGPCALPRHQLDSRPRLLTQRDGLSAGKTRFTKPDSRTKVCQTRLCDQLRCYALQIRMATFSQHHVDGLDLALTPLTYMVKAFAHDPTIKEQEIR